MYVCLLRGYTEQKDHNDHRYYEKNRKGSKEAFWVVSVRRRMSFCQDRYIPIVIIHRFVSECVVWTNGFRSNAYYRRQLICLPLFRCSSSLLFFVRTRDNNFLPKSLSSKIDVNMYNKFKYSKILVCNKGICLSEYKQSIYIHTVGST
jgi:hypothetical protein